MRKNKFKMNEFKVHIVICKILVGMFLLMSCLSKNESSQFKEFGFHEVDDLEEFVGHSKNEYVSDSLLETVSIKISNMDFLNSADTVIVLLEGNKLIYTSGFKNTIDVRVEKKLVRPSIIIKHKGKSYVKVTKKGFSINHKKSKYVIDMKSLE
jgi:hypothetical protein